jgi:glycosyltransferase involved in cell wall biosynthesis
MRARAFGGQHIERPMPYESITVVLPTRNESEGIRRFLMSLPAEIKLVVVDDSTDETREVVRRHRPDHTEVLHLPGTVTEARQMGAAAAASEWLLFTDADVEFAPGYFAGLERRLRGWDVVYGPKCSRDAWARYYRGFCLGQRMLHAIGIPAATGSNLLIRSEALQAVGGFDLRLPCNEDSEVVWRIKRGGFNVSFDQTLKVFEFDHRRLERGAVGKTIHSMLRNVLLYTDLMPDRWRTQDWGYWSNDSQES